MLNETFSVIFKHCGCARYGLYLLCSTFKIKPKAQKIYEFWKFEFPALFLLCSSPSKSAGNSNFLNFHPDFIHFSALENFRVGYILSSTCVVKNTSVTSFLYVFLKYPCIPCTPMLILNSPRNRFGNLKFYDAKERIFHWKFSSECRE